MADHGTLYLSGIEGAGPEAQRRILELVRDRTITPVGGGEKIEVDVRVAASTTADLGERVAKGAFSGDLYEAFQPGTIVVPPLRDRTEDIPLLLHHFLFEENRGRKKPLRGFSQAAVDALSSYSWPGNIQELRQFVKAVSSRKRQGTVVDASDLPAEILYGRRAARAREKEPPPSAEAAEFGHSIEELEKTMALQALALSEGDRERAAALLHIDLPALTELLRRTGIEK